MQKIKAPSHKEQENGEKGLERFMLEINSFRLKFKITYNSNRKYNF